MSVRILALPVLILAVLALGVLVYYICYKAAINRKLREEESGVHRPMASTETVFKWVMVIGVLVIYGSLNSKLAELRSALQNTGNELSNKIYSLQYELHEMREAEKKEASMISGAYYDFGEVDTKEHKAELKLYVSPKSYGEGTEVSVAFRGGTVLLSNNGSGIFTGSTVVPIFEEDYEQCVICISEGGVTKTEVWEDAPQGSLFSECLSQLVLMDSSFGYQSEKNAVKVTGALQIVSSETKMPSFRNMTLCVRKGNTVIDEISMENGYVSVDRSYPIAKGEAISFCIKGVDDYGYIHESHISGWGTADVTAGMSQVSFVNEGYRIYAPDGTLLTK